MSKPIAVIDFVPEGEKTSYFAVNDFSRKKNGGLIARIKEHGFNPEWMDYRELDVKKFDPEKFLAIFYASGLTYIKDPKKRKLDETTRKINETLLPACKIYDTCVEAKKLIVGFTHGSEVIVFYKGGDYFDLKKHGLNYRDEVKKLGGYSLGYEETLQHWLLDDIAEKDLMSKEFTRECRGYGVDLKGSPFKALVYPDIKESGPAIIIPKDGTIDVVLFMIHPEYYRDLKAYQMMENIFNRLKTNYSE